MPPPPPDLLRLETIALEMDMLIPHRELSREALQGIIEEFITREGTDYGETEIPLEAKVARARRQLDEGRCFILYDIELGTVSIISKEHLPDGLD